ncbi:EAL domain-containing protein [Pseudoalteromonas mariniglutinosa]|uniref:bifunctional diguanylate cyclase/phosphodiesterase n=1 Tax=Pseudoalteromonas mariniglutinosa TaxID=206042 RepID=UPI00384E5B5F
MVLSFADTFNADSFYQMSCDEKETLVQQLSELAMQITADYLFIAAVNSDSTEASTSVVIAHQQLIDNFSYPLQGSPCEQLLHQSSCAIAQRVCHRYPQDKLLKKMQIEAYIGVPILADSGNCVGILVGLYSQPNLSIAQHSSRFKTCANYINVLLQKSFLEKKATSRLSLLYEVEEMSNVGAWEYHLQAKKMYWSNQVYRIYGLAINSPITTTTGFAYYALPEQQRLEQLFENALQGQPYCEEFAFTDANGQHKWIRTSGKALKDDQGNVVKIYGAVADITRERQLLASSMDKQNRLAAILDNLNDAVLTVDKQGKIVHANLTAQKIFGYSQQEILNLTVNQLMPDAYAKRHDAYMAHYEQTGEAKIIGIGRQLPAKRKNGDIFQMELSLTKTVNNGCIEYIGVVRDISERIKAQDTIYNLAYSDPITGLRNKRWFEKECKSLLQRGRQENSFIYAALLDIDKLAQFNFKYGIEAGNEALHLIANNLQTTITTDCHLYNNGGDSFLIISTHPFNDLSLLQKVQARTDQQLLALANFTITISDIQVTLSASLGSAIFKAREHSYESLFDKLEYTLKQAKRNAPFGHYFADSAALRRYERTNQLRYLLTSAVQQNELRLVLQPQYIAPNTFNSSEALLRWDSKQFGPVSPAEFIPLAEESDTIINIGDWVLSEVCKLLSNTNNFSTAPCIAVNISAKQIIANDFQDKLMANIERWHVAPSQLVLEITETTLVADLEYVKATMLALNALGFRFSIDDFGTGYSSLSYLKELPIAELKIDKYFVDALADQDDTSSQTIVNMIINMAKALGVNSVAEGVESEQQYIYLKQRGCDLFQGYYFSKPVDIATWQGLISR